MTKVQVFVDPRVVCGTNKGGEDLFLDLVVEVEGDTPPENPEYEVLLSVCDHDCSVQWEEDGDFDETHTNQHEVTYRTYHYEIEWTGEGNSLLEEAGWKERTVKQLLDEACWEFCNKYGEPPRRGVSDNMGDSPPTPDRSRGAGFLVGN